MWQSLNDPEYREQFVEEGINVGIAFQIRSLRNRQDLTQEGLAKKINIKQPLVSSWENPNYGKYNLKTLKELAKAFDVALIVKFISFGEMVKDAVNLTPDRLCPPSFNEEKIAAITGISAIPWYQGVPQNIVSFINSLPPTPSTISNAISVKQGRETVTPMNKEKEMIYAASGNI